MMKQPIFVLAMIWLFISPSFGQSPYEVNWKKEAPYIGAGLGTLGLGAYLRTLPPVFTPDELMTLDKNDINGIDRPTTGNFSTRADHASDIPFYGSHIMPFLFLTGKKTRPHFGQIMAMYGEAATINLGVTVIMKSLFKRPRPFVFNPDVLEETKLTRNAKTSFVSGHTSLTAVNCFFAAKVYSDFYPDSKWKPVVWGGAVTIPAVAGYLRIAAGKHYPTDVLGGYILGAGIGILVPHFHKNKALKNNGLSINAGYDRVHLTWNFNQKPKYQ
jgi:membrane-associated phospholipid phosphatase